MECPRCGREYSDIFHFCPGCGEARPERIWTCSKCGYLNSPDDAFCYACREWHEQRQVAEESLEEDVPPVKSPPTVPYPGKPPPPSGPESWQPFTLTPLMRERYRRAATAPGPYTSKKAFVSLLLSIIGPFFCPVVGSIVAVVIGIMAWQEIKASEGALEGSSMAVWGIALGIVGIGIGIAVIVVVLTYGVSEALVLSFIVPLLL